MHLRRAPELTVLVLIIVVLLLGVLVTRPRPPQLAHPDFVCRQLSRHIVVRGEPQRDDAVRRDYACEPLE